MLAKKFTGEEAVCARPEASLACNNWPKDGAGFCDYVFCLAWLGLGAGQAFHVQFCWLAFFVDAGRVCSLQKAATLCLLFLAVIRML